MRHPRTARLLLFVMAASCADRPGADDDSRDIGGTLVIAAPGSGTTPPFPPHAADAMGRLIADNVYERLAEIGPDLNTVGDRGFTPRLATRWEWAADSLSIAFHLDPRARWHDGQPVRADDVRFTLALLKDPATASQYTAFLTNVDSVSVRDSLTAVVWYRGRSPEQFYQFAYQVFVLPEHILKDVPRGGLATSDAASRPVGSGRFRFARFDPGVRVELVADTAHYRGRAKLDRVIIAFSQETANAVTRLFSGQADLVDALPADVIPRLDTAGSVRAMPYPTLAYGFVVMNLRDPRRLTAPHPILSDRAVRRALSMAVDRQAMLRNIFDTLGVLGAGPFPSALADTGVRIPPFDRTRAAALLDSTGWRAGPDGIRAKNGRRLAFSLIVPTSSAVRMRYAVLLQEQLRSVGARMEIESMDFNPFYERQTTGRFDATINVVSVDPAPSATHQYWGSAGFPPGGGNFGRYANPLVDALIDSIGRSSDPARGRQYRQAMQTIADDAPAIWLYDYVPIAGIHRRIRVEGVRADGWWTGLADWWIPAGERIDRDRVGLRPSAPAQP